MSEQPKKKYDSTVARMAGNIMAGMATRVYDGENSEDNAVNWCVSIARRLIAEVERTEQK